MDDCDLNQKIKALNEIQEMFKVETKTLQDELSSDKEKYKSVKDKVQSIVNLANTMDSFLTTMIGEIDDSRS